MTALRYTWQPLLDALGLDDQTAKRVLGLDVRQVARYRAKGLSERRADELAIAGGTHAWAVWDDWGQETCVECDQPFYPSRKGHTFCTERCFQRRYKREAFRAKYNTDPEFRAARLAAAKRYRESSKKALLVKQRAWKARNVDRQRQYRRRYYLEHRDELLAKQREYDRRRRAA